MTHPQTALPDSEPDDSLCDQCGDVMRQEDADECPECGVMCPHCADNHSIEGCSE